MIAKNFLIQLYLPSPSTFLSVFSLLYTKLQLLLIVCVMFCAMLGRRVWIFFPSCVVLRCWSTGATPLALPPACGVQLRMPFFVLRLLKFTLTMLNLYY